MKHGKYSKTKEVKPYKLSLFIKRYDGTMEMQYFFQKEENAKKSYGIF